MALQSLEIINDPVDEDLTFQEPSIEQQCFSIVIENGKTVAEKFLKKRETDPKYKETLPSMVTGMHNRYLKHMQEGDPTNIEANMLLVVEFLHNVNQKLGNQFKFTLGNLLKNEITDYVLKSVDYTSKYLEGIAQNKESREYLSRKKELGEFKEIFTNIEGHSFEKPLRDRNTTGNSFHQTSIR